jgi:vitamin K-dependent gamma-carboxylase
LFALHGTAVAFAYGGLLLDLSAGPLLLWRRTRLLALGVTSVFHLLNLITFRIGIFPVLAISLGLLFLPASWVRRPLRRFLPTEAALGRLPGAHPWVMPSLAAFFLVQLLLPLRHHLIEGDVAWSGQGHRFSWRMMLDSKRGEAVFHVFDPASGERFDVRPEEYLHGRQIAKLATKPDMIWQFARMLEEHYRGQGRAEVEIRATVRMSLNFRPPELLLDPSVDLTAVDYSPFRRPTWLLPGPTEAEVGD